MEADQQREPSFTSARKPRKFLRIICPIVFACTVTLAAVLVVCLTTPEKAKQQCAYVFQPLPSRIDDLDSEPRSVVVEDLNHDRHPDLLLVYANTHTLAIYLGRGDGTFDAPLLHLLAWDSRPVSLAVGRLNNDDHFDVAVADVGTHSISVMFGIGNGSMTQSKTYSTTTSRPQQVSLADLTGDGRLDILVLGEDTVLLFVNVGEGAFVYTKSYSTGADSLPCAMAVADVNGDEAADIIVANNGTDDLIIFFGDENRTDIVHQKVMPMGIGAQACALVVDDVDLIVTKSGRREIEIWRGDGNGSFRTDKIISTNQRTPFAVGVTDFNRDGQRDLMVIYRDENRLEMFLGQKNGSFISEAVYFSGLSSSPSSFALADLNNDSRLDAVVTYIDTNSLAVFLGFNWVSVHSQPFNISTDIQVFSVSYPIVFLMDFDADHHQDIIIRVSYTAFGVWLGDGTDRLQDPTFYDMQNYFDKDFLLKDMNDDGRIDVVISGSNGTSIDVFLQLPDQTFAAPLVSPIDLEAEGLYLDLHLIDVNSDRIPDLFVLHPTGTEMFIFLGHANGTFDYSSIVVTIPDLYYALYDFGDINGDTYIDILFAQPGQGFYALYGLGNGSFVTVSNYTSTIGLNFGAMVLRDINDDKHLDLITIDDVTSLMSVHFGDGHGRFDREAIYPLQLNRWKKRLYVGDFNGDLVMDVAIIYADDSSTRIYLGVGNGSLMLEDTQLIKTFIESWAIGDLNGDGRLDWITFGYFAVTLHIGYDAGTLLNPTSHVTGAASRPSVILADDFNQDHRWDLVLLNAGQQSITVRSGRGDGTFTDGMAYSTGDQSSLQAMVMGDFNDDGITDLVVVKRGTSSIALFTGLTNGSFVYQSSFSTGIGSRPSAITAAHLNDDRWLDLAVTDDNSNTTSLFIHFRYPRLIQQKFYQTDVDWSPKTSVIADFNGDQHMDIAVIQTLPAQYRLAILLGDGEGNFTDQFIFPISSEDGSPTLFAADFDRNNQTDLLLTDPYSPNSFIFFNFNQSSWSEIITYQLDPSISRPIISVADLNNDHYPDLIIVGRGTNQVRVTINQRNKTFALPYSCCTKRGHIYFAVYAGYFNNDTHVDLIFINFLPGTRYIYHGNGDGTFNLSSNQTSTMDYVEEQMLCTDVNNDGLSDLVVTYNSRISVHVRLSQSDSATAVKEFVYSNPLLDEISAIRAADFNEDGHVDLAIVSQSNDGMLIILHGFGDGTFGREVQFAIEKTAWKYYAAVGDLNDDGISDIVIIRSIEGSITPHLIVCCDPFSNASILPNQLNTSANFITSGDFNRDNRSDLIVSYRGTNQLGLFLSHGNDTFDDRTLFSARSDSRPKFIAVGDLNNDDRMDLVVICDDEERIDVYFGDSTGPTFHFNRSYSIGPRSQPRSLLIADFNNDTHLEVIVTDDATNSVGILLGTGDGSLRPDWHLYTGYATNPTSLAMGDFDGDGELDLAATLSKTNTIGLIRRECDD